ncbi:DoxX family protein [Cohnella sp. AR92]|uniref:DoxX family protein n=1 Tax=Cohnella sp. AR92 TaxID=648716 RepID=UPI000F8ED6CB|nr:DoxX family protein [Cohnella sp. AR92]RUS46254.1 DoxX family protein [Cohnella sp. AR92]
MPIIVLQIMLSAAFLVGGLSKLAGAKPQLINFKRWRLPPSMRMATGAVEMLGAALMLLGIWTHGFAAWGGILLGGTMIGAIFVHFRAQDKISLWVPAIVFLCVSLAVTVNYASYLF